MGTREPDTGPQYVGVAQGTRSFIQQYWIIWELSKVVIAQAHGYVLAGGTELCFACDLLVVTPDCRIGHPATRGMAAPDLMWYPWFLPMRKAREMMFTGDNITGEQAYHFGMANYCVPESEIDEFTEIFAKRVALMSWQQNSLRKRGINMQYEIQGIRTAMQANPPLQHLVGQTERVKYYDELITKVPLREYLTTRDGPYRDYRTQEEAILKRAAREGEAWKKVTEEAKGRVSEDVARVERMKIEKKP